MVWRGYTHPWEPWEALNEAEEEMSRLLSGTFGEASREYPPINVWASDERAVVIAHVPGIAADQLEVSVINDTVILKGARVPEEIPAGAHYHRRERGFGRFTRSVRLPFRVADEDVKARVRDGMVRIDIPRSSEDRPQRISVREA
ncbi:MAG: Hsp20/alpha crystallin family protein [Nitrospirota bacterium]|jgi:HSP20 family protein